MSEINYMQVVPKQTREELIGEIEKEIEFEDFRLKWMPVVRQMKKKELEFVLDLIYLLKWRKENRI